MPRNVLVPFLLMLSTVNAQLTSQQATAIELNGASLTSSIGATGWVVVTDDNSVNGSHLETAPVAIGSSTTLTLLVEDASTVSFRWQTDSEEFSGEFSFEINGIVQDTISGSAGGWINQTYNLGAGGNVLIWRMSLDEDAFEEDKGMLDQVFIDGVSALQLVTPSASDGSLNEAYFMELVGNYEGYTTELISGALPAGLTFDGQNNLIYGIPTQTGTFPLSIRPSLDELSSVDLGLEVVIGSHVKDLASSISLGMPTRDGGASFWYSDLDPDDVETDILRSGALNAGERSVVTLPVYGPTVMSFDWKVDSTEAFDFLCVSLDGVEQESISGYTSWTSASVVVPAGYHEITFSYERDAEVEAQGEDAGYVRQVAFTGYMQSMTAAGSLVQITPTQDADADGVANVWEYLYGTQPAVATDYPALNPTYSNNSLHMDLPATAPLSEVTFKAFSSTDLETFTEQNVTYDQVNERLEATFPSNNEIRQFFYFQADL